MDKSGDLFGTTVEGGVGNPGFGVFKLTFIRATEKYALSVLYSFCLANTNDCGDGDHPQAGVIRDKTGNIYGTTASTISNDQFSNGGTVYRLTPAGKESFVIRFCGSVCRNGKSNGTGADAGLIMDASGNLYGTTGFGGANGDGGKVFEVMK